MAKPQFQVINDAPGIKVIDAILHQGHTVPMVFTGTNQLNAKKSPGLQLYFIAQYNAVLIKSEKREVLVPLTNFIFIELESK